MSNGQNHEEPKKRSLGSKILWGGMIAGAVVAIAATVAFVFAPQTAMDVVNGGKSAMTGLHESIGQAGNWLTDNVVGRGVEGGTRAAVQDFITSAYKGAGEFGTWIGEKVIGSYNFEAAEKASEVAKDAFNADRSWINPLKWAGWLGHETDGMLKVAAEKSLEAAHPQGIIGQIVQHKALALGGAAVATYAVSKATSGPTEAEVRMQAARTNRQAEGFAMKEDMRKMQAVMVARAAAAGQPEALSMQGQALS